MIMLFMKIYLIQQARMLSMIFFILDEISTVYVNVKNWTPIRNRNTYLPTINMKKGISLVALYFAFLNFAVCTEGELITYINNLCNSAIQS